MPDEMGTLDTAAILAILSAWLELHEKAILDRLNAATGEIVLPRAEAEGLVMQMSRAERLLSLAIDMESLKSTD